MEFINFVQGSPEWLEYRRTKFNASDAPAMMGCSPYKTRGQLLKELATGLTAEIGSHTQQLFDKGHAFEALARPLAEEMIGEELYPCVGSLGRLSASFDGLTLTEEVAFEHKMLNDDLRQVFADIATIAPKYRDVGAGERLPLHYRVQMQQQCMVSGATRVLFMATRWADDGTLLESHECWYLSDAQLAQEITNGWLQFAADLGEFKPVEVAAEVVGRTPETLPALLIQVTGAVTASNLGAFKTHALDVLQGINRKLETDQQFADADKTVKWCSEVEDKLAAAKQHALSQTASIDELFRTVDDISAEVRRVRLELDKLVKARKEAIRQDIVMGGHTAMREHIASLNERIGKPLMSYAQPDFAGVVKGLKTVASLKNAVDTELARAKIAANETADRITLNLRVIDAQPDLAFLFPDLANIVMKQPDDLAALVKVRVAEHEKQEKARADAKVAKAAEDAATALAAAAAKPAPTPAQASAPAPAPVLAAAQDLPIPWPTARRSSVDERPTLKLGDINTRLGFTVTADFLAGLGFTATQQQQAKLFRESDWTAICQGISAHVMAVAQVRKAA